MFVPSKPLQPSLIFVDKAKSRTPERVSRLRTYSQTLDKAKRPAREKHNYLQIFVTYGRKKCYNIRPPRETCSDVDVISQTVGLKRKWK